MLGHFQKNPNSPYLANACHRLVYYDRLPEDPQKNDFVITHALAQPNSYFIAQILTSHPPETPIENTPFKHLWNWALAHPGDSASITIATSLINYSPSLSATKYSADITRLLVAAPYKTAVSTVGTLVDYPDLIEDNIAVISTLALQHPHTPLYTRVLMDTIAGNLPIVPGITDPLVDALLENVLNSVDIIPENNFDFLNRLLNSYSADMVRIESIFTRLDAYTPSSPYHSLATNWATNHPALHN